MLYPSPTVWSSHILIALDEKGQDFLDALLDGDIQEIAWKRHGFRTGNYGTLSDPDSLAADGVAASISQVTPVPSYDTMKIIIESLQ